MMDPIPVVRGNRICRICKGLCHEGSWRSNYGYRKAYYCCRAHLLKFVAHPNPRLFERVDVISR